MCAFHCLMFVICISSSEFNSIFASSGKAHSGITFCSSCNNIFHSSHFEENILCPWLEVVLCSLVVTPVSAKFLQSSTHGELLVILSLYLAFGYTLYACKSDVRLLTFTPPWGRRGGGGVKSRIRPPYPQRVVKED